MKNNKITTYLLALLLCSASCSKDKADSNVEQFSTGKAFNKENNAISSTPGYYNIATYNVRKITSSDTGNQAWSVRRQYVKQMILNYDFDIFGVQEPTGPQIDNMIADLTSAGYAKFGVSDHNDHAYQHQDIFYKTAKFTLLSSGKFWLAPGAPTSVPSDTTPWDNYYHTSVVTYGKFRDKVTLRDFFVFNAHFNPGAPNGGTPTAEVAMQEDANLMITQIKILAGELPVIFMGDLNRNQTTAPFATLNNSILLQESWDLAGTKIPTSRQTGNWWVLNPSGNSQIDHIFVTEEAQWDIVKRTVCWDNFSGILPSDHFPVVAEMKLLGPDVQIANGTYKLSPKHNPGMILCVTSNSTASGARVVQTNTLTAASGKWIFARVGTTGYYTIKNAYTGLYMTVSGNSMAIAAPVVQATYTSGTPANDEWSLTPVGGGYYRVVNRHSGLGLRVENCSTATGAKVDQYPYLGYSGPTCKEFLITLEP